MTARVQDVEAGPNGPALRDTEDQALLAAMRTLWPLLSPAGRAEAIRVAASVGGAP